MLYSTAIKSPIVAVYELTPVTSQKSFYGKARVLITDAGAYLISYDTVVCAIVNGELLRLWNGYSVTTMRHVNSFCALYGLPGLSKSDWHSLDVMRL